MTDPPAPVAQPLGAARLAEWLHKHGHTFDQPVLGQWHEITDEHRLRDMAVAGEFLATLDAARSVPSDRPASDPDNASHDATTPAGLDVDRLARAMDMYDERRWPLDEEHRTSNREAAAEIAADYARLQSEALAPEDEEQG